MHKIPLSSLSLQMVESIYWEKKEKFLLYEDIYPDWVMFAIEDGAFYYEIEGTKGTASFGDLVICPPETVFRRVIVTPLTFHFMRLNWIETASGERLEDGVPVGKISILDTQRLAQNFAAMKKWLAWPKEIRLSMNNHYCRDMWLLYCDELGEGSLPSSDRAKRIVDPLMQKAHTLILQQAFSALNLKQIAQSLAITPVQLTRKFNAAYGVTPLRYLTTLRLKRAKTLLLETKMTIEQIAECCGYQNGFYLTRVFAKYEHTTPSLYRKNHLV